MGDESVNPTFLSGRVFFSVPDHLICPACGNCDFHILSLRKWNELYSSQNKKEVVNNVQEFLAHNSLQIPTNIDVDCQHPYHYYFLDGGEGLTKDLLEKLPTSLVAGHPGLQSHKLSGGEREQSLIDYLATFRECFVYPILESIDWDRSDLHLSIAPRHQLFSISSKPDSYVSPEWEKAKTVKENLIPAIPLLPVHISDLSHYMVITDHFKEILGRIEDYYCSNLESQRINIRVFFGSGNISIRCWLLLLQNRDLEPNFVFWDYLWDPRSEKSLDEIPTEQNMVRGYHKLPSLEYKGEEN